MVKPRHDSADRIDNRASKCRIPTKVDTNNGELVWTWTIFFGRFGGNFTGGHGCTQWQCLFLVLPACYREPDQARKQAHGKGRARNGTDSIQNTRRFYSSMID